MKRDALILTVAAFFCGITFLHSQQPQSAMTILQGMKATNADLIEQQKKTLETLDEMEKTAQQIKIFGKRT